MLKHYENFDFDVDEDNSDDYHPILSLNLKKFGAYRFSKENGEKGETESEEEESDDEKILANIRFEKSAAEDHEFYDEPKEDIPAFVAFILHFFCFVFSLIVSLLGMIFVRKLLFPGIAIGIHFIHKFFRTVVS